MFLRPRSKKRPVFIEYLMIFLVLAILYGLFLFAKAGYTKLFTKDLTICGTVESATVVPATDDESRMNVVLVGYPQFVFNAPNPQYFVQSGEIVFMDIKLPPGTAMGTIQASKLTVFSSCP